MSIAFGWLLYITATKWYNLKSQNHYSVLVHATHTRTYSLWTFINGSKFNQEPAQAAILHLFGHFIL